MMHVLASAEARIFLSEYLDSQQPEGEAGRQMLNFWETSEVLKSAASAEKHQLATEIFYTHVNAPNSAVLVEKVFYDQFAKINFNLLIFPIIKLDFDF